jgi:hypothetical protein
MSFPYYASHVPADLKATFAPRALEMERKEIRERAGILMRLGHTQPDVTVRMKQYVAWEFEMHGKPAVAAEVEELVAGVYSRATPSAQKPKSK